MQPMVSVDQLRGKEQAPETVEIDLSTLIDVKGMKAMGNRLSQQLVKKVELMAELEPEKEDVSEPGDDLDETDDTASTEPDAEETPVQPLEPDENIKVEAPSKTR